MLVAFNEEAYNTHKDDVGEDGVIVYNSGDFSVENSEHSNRIVPLLALALQQMLRHLGHLHLQIERRNLASAFY